MANEKRLIDANAFIKHFERAKEIAKFIPGELGNIFCGLYEECIEEINKQPTVDAVEVVHGEWEITEDDYFDLVELKCSACGESYGFEAYEDCIPMNYHYCPNCGAKMDGDGNA